MNVCINIPICLKNLVSYLSNEIMYDTYNNI